MGYRKHANSGHVANRNERAPRDGCLTSLRFYPARVTHVASRRATRRTGFTALEAAVGGAIIVVLLIVAIPTIFYSYRYMLSRGCQKNMFDLGMAIRDYHTNHAESLPCGAHYEANNDTPWGTSWWVDLLPYIDSGIDGSVKWQHQASSGIFSTPLGNSNIKIVDGLLPSLMFCPSSPLPALNDPHEHLSEATRKMLKDRPALGIAVPSYVAIAGSAPDMFGLSRNQSVMGPHGRNTRDGKYGILSGSGAFPPNQVLRLASLKDGEANVVIVGEQSTWGVDTGFSEPVKFDLRSAWADGAYAGAGGRYQILHTDAKDINGSGDEPCYNITTIRYGINQTTNIDITQPAHGIVVHHKGPFPQPEEGQPPRVPAPMPPGPGHNHGLFSAHVGGAYVLFADGHVEFKTDATDLVVLQMLVTRDDGNIAQ